MFLSRALALSLFLHALFFALLFFRIPPQVEPPPPAVFVELPEATVSPEQRPAKVRSPRRLMHQGLGGFLKQPNLPAEPGLAEAGSFFSSGPSFHEASISIEEDSGPNRARAERVRKKLEPHLFYPDFLTDLQIFGEVKALLKISSDGALVSVNIDPSAQPELAELVAEAVHDAFLQPIQNPVGTPEAYFLRLSVIYRNGEGSFARGSHIRGQSIFFSLLPEGSAILAYQESAPIFDKVRAPGAQREGAVKVDLFSLGEAIFNGRPKAAQNRAERLEMERMRRKRRN